MYKLSRTICLFMVLNAAAGMAGAASMYYQPGFTDDLYVFDTVSGMNVKIGDMGIADSWGFAFNPSGTLYGFNRNSQSLFTINTSTAALSLVGPANLFDVESLTFDREGTNLYVSSGNNLYDLDIATAAPTLVGSIGAEMDGLAVNPLTGVIYGVDSGAFYQINPAVPSSAYLGYIPADETLEFGPDGTLYGVNGSSVYVIDPATLDYTYIGSIEGTYAFASAIAPGAITPSIPAPAAILLGTLGTGLIGWLRRRRAL